jgi:hypothetical protein
LIAEANILSHLRHRTSPRSSTSGPATRPVLPGHGVLDGTDLGEPQRGSRGRRGCRSTSRCTSAPGSARRSARPQRPRSDGKSLRLVHRDVSPSNARSKSGEIADRLRIAKRPEEQTGHGGVRASRPHLAGAVAERARRRPQRRFSASLYELVLDTGCSLTSPTSMRCARSARPSSGGRGRSIRRSRRSSTTS